jgi:hypothetical protein
VDHFLKRRSWRWIIGQQKALPGNILLSSLESMTVELDESNQLREVFETLSLEDDQLYSEDYFFGDFNCPVNQSPLSLNSTPSLIWSESLE